MFWAGDVLDPHQRLFLDENLESGIGRSTPTPHAPRSVLASGITGSVRLVEVRARVEDRSPAELPPSVTDAAARSGDASGPAPLPRRDGGARAAAPQRPAGPETHATIEDIPRFDASRTLIEVVRKTAATLPESSPGVEVEGRFGRIVVDRVHLRMDIARPDLLPLDISELDLQLRTADGAESGDGSMPYGVGLWRLVLAVSAGRLPQDLDPDGTHRLRRWPDLARVDRIDGDTKMSALLQRAPMTLTALSDEIGPAATVASFATATWLTGLLEPSGPVTGAARGPRSAAEPAGVVDAAAGPGGAERWGALRSLARRFRKGTS